MLALRGWRLRCGAAGARALPAACVAAIAFSGCGETSPGSRTAAGRDPEPGAFQVRLTAAFPALQRLAQRSELVIAVRNAGRRAIPDIAVTLLNPRYGTAAQALGTLIAPAAPGAPILASRSRPVWVIDRAPGRCGSSCRQSGPGGATTSDPDTWALGRLAPGATATFTWRVTAVRPGRYAIAYRIAASPAGNVRAALGRGGRPAGGRLRVTISSRPGRPHVTGSGRVVYSG